MSSFQCIITRLLLYRLSGTIMLFECKKSYVLSIDVLHLSEAPRSTPPTLDYTYSLRFCPQLSHSKCLTLEMLVTTMDFFTSLAQAYLPSLDLLNVGLVFQLPSRNIHDCSIHTSVQLIQNKIDLFCS